MFLIRRKSDGKYWRNLSYHQRRDKPQWQDRPDGIKPFMRRSGARNALNCFCYDKIAYGEWFKWNLNRDKFDRQFEIVEVKVSLK